MNDKRIHQILKDVLTDNVTRETKVLAFEAFDNLRDKNARLKKNGFEIFENDWEAVCKVGNKIAAIKMFKTFVNASLRDAKDTIEAYENEMAWEKR